MSHFKVFLADRKLLHDHIANGDIVQVTAILEKFPGVKHVYNDVKESAAAAALKSRQFEIYELLISRQLSLGPHEEIEDFVKGLSLQLKRDIREIHKINAQDSSIKHITALTSKCKLSHDASKHKRREFHEIITKAFEDLNEIKWIEPMLKVVALAEQLNIVLDFNRDSVVHIDPTNGKRVKGICYIGRGDVYIGAKGFLESNENRFKALGVLAHELGHYAMQLVFKNDAKPYQASDDESREVFDKIMKACEVKKAEEPFIDVVFSYPKEVQSAEMIVRVPHLLAMNKGNERKIFELEEYFSQLFDFYEMKTLVEFEKSHPLMEAKLIVKDLNELCGMKSHLEDLPLLKLFPINLNFDAVSLITSNCPQLTMKSIHQQVEFEDTFEASFVFLKAETLQNDKIFNLFVKAFGVNTNLKLIIDCNEQKEEEIAKKLLDNGMNKSIVFVANEPSNLKYFEFRLNVKHSWSQLTDEARNEFLELKLKFQGHEMLLKDILDVDSEALEIVPLKVLLEQKLEIGKEAKFDDVKFHIERKILSLKLEVGTEELIWLAEAQKLFLLSDEPGAGKTTEFKMMAKKLKEKFPSKWIAFIDLKLFVSAYEKDGRITKSFETRESIAKFLTEKILKIESFEAKTFKSLFEADRVVLLLDGFDEISPSFKHFNILLAQALKTLTRNQLWISTRPHLEKELQEKLNREAFRLKPFTRKERKEFFKEILRSKNVSEEDLKQNLLKIEEFLTSIERNSLMGDSMLNPIILRMVAEIMTDESCADLFQFNLHSIYETFVKKMIANYMEKGPVARKELTEMCTGSTAHDIMSFHYKSAFETIFLRNESNSVKKLIKTSFKSVKAINIEQMVRIGLISSDGDGFLQFIHRTFAEFFIADFLFKKVFFNPIHENQKPSNSVSKLFKSIWTGDVNDSRDILSFLTSVAPRPIETILLANCKMIRVFIDSAFQWLIFEKDAIKLKRILQRDFRTVLHQAIREGRMNIIKILAFHLVDNRNEINAMWLQQNLEEFDGGNAMMNAVENQTVNFLRKFLLISHDVLDSDSFKKMFLDQDKFSRNIFFYAVQNRDQKVLEFLWSNPLLPLSVEEKKEFFFAEDNRGNNLLDHSMKYQNNNQEVMKIRKTLEENAAATSGI